VAGVLGGGTSAGVVPDEVPAIPQLSQVLRQGRSAPDGEQTARILPSSLERARDLGVALHLIRHVGSPRPFSPRGHDTRPRSASSWLATCDPSLPLCRGCPDQLSGHRSPADRESPSPALAVTPRARELRDSLRPRRCASRGAREGRSPPPAVPEP